MSSAMPSNPAAARRWAIAGDWLFRLREDTLSEEQMAEWIAWCESDTENLRAFEQLQSLWQAAGEYSPEVAVVSALMKSDDSSAPALERHRQFRTPRRRGAAVAASIGVFAIAGVLYWNTHHALPEIKMTAAVDQVRTPVALNQRATLPDGSRVDLGARSVLDINFTAARRQLQLRDGQAFFQVEQDKTRPFVIDAGAIQIVAIGTAFDVRRTPNQVTVTVQEGTVEVLKDHAASATAGTGYQLVFDPHTAKLRKSLVDPAVALAWRSGRLEFTGDSLETVIASVNRYSQHPVVLSTPELGKLIFTGTVFIDSIDASLDGLEQVFPITVHREANRVILAPSAAAKEVKSETR